MAPVSFRCARHSRQRRSLIVALGVVGAVAAWPLPGFSQRQRRPRIGYLLLTPLTEPPSRERQAFLDGLAEQGLVPGRTVDIVYRSAEGEADFLEEASRDLLAQKPDVIAAPGAPPVLAALKTTRSVPIVMLAVGDPIGIGAVTSLAKPGGNVTGVSFLSSELAPKRLEYAKECVPNARTMAAIWDRRNPNARAEADALVAAVGQQGLRMESLGLASDAELRRSLRRLSSARPDLLYVAFEGGLAAANRTALAQFALAQRIPLVSGWSSLTEAGGLLSYAPDIPSMFRRSAYYVARVLKGARPENLPIELPTTVELVVNSRTAQAIGVTLPPELLLRADRVIR